MYRHKKVRWKDKSRIHYFRFHNFSVTTNLQFLGGTEIVYLFLAEYCQCTYKRTLIFIRRSVKLETDEFVKELRVRICYPSLQVLTTYVG